MASSHIAILFLLLLVSEHALLPTQAKECLVPDPTYPIKCVDNFRCSTYCEIVKHFISGRCGPYYQCLCRIC
ncbi:hypothetical protein Lal_00023322 [Lupinus albus]|uniref:Putative knottin, scorpion toxin n=1 Tax=Lupinus albus TaxID=3870 RepID=A0A6A4NVN5_LUPAL|nr:putative knottin, scorpion toxin [Lupinus albus]KAF1881286.1 hypothetical protein Lal_00023322 [Lupinus albus]